MVTSDAFDDRAVFVTGPVVVFQWRNEPGWPVDYVSPNAGEVFGYPSDDFLSGRVVYADLILPEDAPRVASEVAAATSSDATSFVHEPYRVRHRSGGVRWLYDSTRIKRRADGSAQAFLGYVIDITDRVAAETEKRDLERRLNHSQKLESLGVLAGGVAHDFNNVLTGILAHAGLVRRTLTTPPPDVTDSLQQIEKLAQRASHLTRQLLAYAGKGRFVVEALDLSEIVRELVAMLEIVLPKNATLKLELERDLPSVVADRGEMQQVVMNLLTNASEALRDEPGEVTIATSLRHLDAAEISATFSDDGLEPGDFVHLEVSDTGSGMTPDVRARLFDPFFTTKQSGRGLGMSAVLGIVRAHHGAIRVDSAPGRGTTFRLWFPCSAHPVSVPSVPPPAGPWRGAGTVLIVDDEAAIRSALGTLVGDMGFSILLAENGRHALELFDAAPGDVVLVLLDLTMPLMGGAEAFARLRARAPTLPVIMMSGYSEQQAFDRLSGESRTGFLGKPYSVDALEALIRSLLAEGNGAEPC